MPIWQLIHCKSGILSPKLVGKEFAVIQILKQNRYEFQQFYNQGSGGYSKGN